MNRWTSLVVVALATVASSAQWAAPGDLPAFHPGPPQGPLASVLKGQQLTGPNFAHRYQAVAYQMAAKVPAVLYQMPCFCRCDKALGHSSLHSCFEGLHGAECSTCMKEGVYTYLETRRGRTPAQIRSGIERGEWVNVDLENAKL